MSNSLWSPVTVGRLNLEHRLAMAPMTRSRAGVDGVLREMNAEYYAQRASMGLLISEGTQPSVVGQGYMNTPGICNEAQVAGWQLVTDAVHERGGHLFIQLMHAGRIAHPDNTVGNLQSHAPSAIKPAGMMFTKNGMVEMPEPHAMTTEEVVSTIDDFRKAAALAISAGADGVEIHAANGYLVQQFLAENSNQRTDQYGGSIENRTRFAVEVAKAIVDEIGADRVGIRISPANVAGDIAEGDSDALYRALIPQLAELNLAYLHVLQSGSEELLQWMRSAWPTTLILNRPGRELSKIGDDIENGLADIEAIGAPVLANPDFAERLQKGAGEFNDPDPATFYDASAGAKGYTDYPTLV